MALFTESLGERTYASQYRTPALGLTVYQAGISADADGPVTVTVKTLDEATTLQGPVTADHPDVGAYEFTLTSAATATVGVHRVEWAYTLDGEDQTYIGLLEVGPASAAYDALSDDAKVVVEGVWRKFADLYDSPDGGPHLQVYFQTRFGRGRIAELMPGALARLNSMAQPHQTYDMANFPYAEWSYLVGQLTYIEVLKHLRRSYLEQPDLQGSVVGRLDRKDYFGRWGQIITEEEQELKSHLDTFKIAHMGLGRGRVLVDGGIYAMATGRAPKPPSMAARPYYWAAYY